MRGKMVSDAFRDRSATSAQIAEIQSLFGVEGARSRRLAALPRF
jgi:hypothetical protein